MDRELRRVPLDFCWPLNQPYEGFINPYYRFRHQCEACEGSGYSFHANRMHHEWYGNDVLFPFDPVAYGSQLLTADDPVIVEEISRKIDRSIELSKRGQGIGYDNDNPDFSEYYTSNGRISREQAIQIEIRRMLRFYNSQWMHHLIQVDIDVLQEAGRFDNYPTIALWTPRQYQELSISNSFFGNNDEYYLIKARCAREGHEVTCSACQGDGERWESAESKKLFDEWERTCPPEGDGYQVWETVSEGSPISPVFSTVEALATHMATTKWGGDKGTPSDVWLKWINGPGHSFSMVSVDGEWMDGVTAAVKMSE